MGLCRIKRPVRRRRAGRGRLQPRRRAEAFDLAAQAFGEVGSVADRNSANLIDDEPALRVRMCGITRPLRRGPGRCLFAGLPCPVQSRDGAGGKPRLFAVGAAGEDDRHRRAEREPRGFRMRHENQLLGQHVAGFDVRHDQDFGMAGHQRGDALGLGRLDVDGIVHGERTIDDAAPDLAALGHLGRARRRRASRGFAG